MTNLTDQRRIVFRHANGDLYSVTRNGGKKHPGYQFFRPGASQSDEDIVVTEELSELARAVLQEGCTVHCKNLSTGTQHYWGFREGELISYEIAPEIAEAVGIPETGSVGEENASLSRHTIEAAMDAYDSYRKSGAHSEIFNAFGEPRDYWVRSSRERENRVYPTKPINFFVNRDSAMGGGWGARKSGASALHNAGFIIVNEDDTPVEVPSKSHLMKGADRIRLCALNYYLEPAREKAAKEVSVRAGDLAAAMGLKDAFPNICQALGGKKFQKLAQVAPPTSTEPNPSSSTVFTYTLTPQPEADAVTNTNKAPASSATNLILYGPPGTGKTYRTAWEAVRLCLGEQVASGLKGGAQRADLMSLYRKLVDEGRIEFVTFHQSMSYEEFVEGLRPTTGNENMARVDENESSSGFRLECHDGIFKRICEVARLDPGEDGQAQHLDRKQGIFKLSLNGANWKEKFSAAIHDKKISWGFGAGIDWSAPEYEDFQAIKQKWLARNPGTDGRAADITGTWHFRGAAEQGSYVLLTVGKNLAVALGRISGDYEFNANSTDVQHSRGVEWIWVDEQGAQRSEFYPNSFSAFQPLYQLASDRIDWDALEAIAFDGAEPEAHSSARSHVLIIDEINRANISKVFGELITLLEPDKRLGMSNEIRLRLPYSKKLFGVPRNLHIIGTMNTADRSIALLDTALRRRFTFHELMPDPSVLSNNVDGVDLQKLLSTINMRIEYLFDRDHQIGHAYFAGCETRQDIESAMRDKVIPLLAEYFYEDWSKVAAVLGDVEQGPSRFLSAERIAAPGGMSEDDFSGEKLRWLVKESFDFSEFAT